ncbi:Uncharacterised protein [Candidatus Tiddalikarchaeum anstoanum]|nr:Uncharacterised protein [Candidatus Tiddalikarchaeum anstoanum]
MGLGGKTGTGKTSKRSKKVMSEEAKLAQWNKLYCIKTDPNEINKEKGDFYELYTLYLIQPYLNNVQRRNLYRYVINSYARTAELYLKDKAVFESDVFLSLRRDSKFTRWLQKIFNIHDEFGFNAQCKKYKVPVNDDHVSYDSGQVCFAKVLGNNIIKNTVPKLGKDEEILEQVGELYLTYNVPIFQNLSNSLDGVLIQLKNSYLNTGQIVENFNNEEYSFNISQIVDYTVDIEQRRTLSRKERKMEQKKLIKEKKKPKENEAVENKEEVKIVKYHILKVKTEKEKSLDGSAEIYYAESAENNFKILEQKYRVSLGNLVLVRQKHKVLPDKYYFVNLADEKNYDTIKETIETFLNPEMFGYTAPFGLEASAKLSLDQVNGVYYTAESFRDVFKKNNFFKEFKKFIDIPHYSVLRSSEGDLEKELDKKLAHLVSDGKLKKKSIVTAVENFVIKD